MQKSSLKAYAKLIAKKGANVQKGQDVWITASIDQPQFVEMLVKECYALGAKRVTVDWEYLPLTVLDSKYVTLKELSSVKDWQKEKMQYQADNLPVRIYLESDDPDGLNKADQEKMAKARMAQYPIRKPYIDAIENKYQWCIAAVPSKAWAKKVFPDEKVSSAVEKLWLAILTTSRALGDPIANWTEHNSTLHAKCDILNSLNLRSLHYTSEQGTDLRVGLLPNADFLAGSETTLGKNVEFNPNIPSEEVFTTPKAGEAEGIVYATKPLSYQGVLIEDFSMEFKDGKVVKVSAKKNQAQLEQMVSMDDGAKMLGECALVPQNSPIAESNLLFFNTLFDENASCHLALGRGFSNCIKDYEKYTQDDFDKMGVNTSMIHVDFMIGSDTLDIEGTTADGRQVQIFKNGRWAI